MASISSLLKSAESARKKKLAYEDDVAAFIWQNSAKTIDDWNGYNTYLSNRQSTAPTGSDQLSYAKKLKSAEDSYVSAEIERATIDVLDGTGTTMDKYNRVTQLYTRAVERGNFDLAQNLYTQAKRLEDTLIDEQEKAQRVAGAMALNGVKAVKDLISIINGDTPQDFMELADGTQIKTRTGINNELKATGESENGIFADALFSAQAMQSLVEDAYQSATTQEAVDKIERDDTMRKILTGEYTMNIGGKNLTIDELDLAARSAAANNPLYSVASKRNAKGETEFALVNNNVEDFVWARNDDGTYEAIEVQTRRTKDGLKTQISSSGSPLSGEIQTAKGEKINVIDDNGIVTEVRADGGDYRTFYDPKSKKTIHTKGSDSLNIQNRLESLGYKVIGGSSGGKFTIETPGGELIQGATIEDGKVKFFGPPNEFSQDTSGLYEIDLTGAPGNLRAVSPDETSDFGIESEFGGQLSKSSDLGKSATLSLAGISKYSSPRADLNSIVDNLQVRAIARQEIGGVDIGLEKNFVPGTSSLLQRAGTLSERVKLQAFTEANINKAPALQPAQTPGLNQTPLERISSSGAPVRQLKVSQAPQRQRITSVGFVTPNRKITGVTSAPTFTGNLQVR